MCPNVAVQLITGKPDKQGFKKWTVYINNCFSHIPPSKGFGVRAISG